MCRYIVEGCNSFSLHMKPVSTSTDWEKRKPQSELPSSDQTSNQVPAGHLCNSLVLHSVTSLTVRCKTGFRFPAVAEILLFATTFKQHFESIQPHTQWVTEACSPAVKRMKYQHKHSMHMASAWKYFQHTNTPSVSGIFLEHRGGFYVTFKDRYRCTAVFHVFNFERKCFSFLRHTSSSLPSFLPRSFFLRMSLRTRAGRTYTANPAAVASPLFKGVPVRLS